MDSILTEESFPVTYVPITALGIAMKCRKWARDRKESLRLEKQMGDRERSLRKWRIAESLGVHVQEISEDIPPHIISEGKAVTLKIT